jgi:RimJ/RimL family protein N-acetyltransferase
MPVGHTYLSKSDEIGVFVTKSFHSMGIGRKAVEDLMRLHKRERYLANINPVNFISQEMFKKLGFKQIQFTFEKCPVASGVTA